MKIKNKLNEEKYLSINGLTKEDIISLEEAEQDLKEGRTKRLAN